MAGQSSETASLRRNGVNERNGEAYDETARRATKRVGRAERRSVQRNGDAHGHTGRCGLLERNGEAYDETEQPSEMKRFAGTRRRLRPRRSGRETPSKTVRRQEPSPCWQNGAHHQWDGIRFGVAVQRHRKRRRIPDFAFPGTGNGIRFTFSVAFP